MKRRSAFSKGLRWDNAEEAATYRRKADATKVAKGLGSRFFVAELA